MSAILRNLMILLMLGVTEGQPIREIAVLGSAPPPGWVRRTKVPPGVSTKAPSTSTQTTGSWIPSFNPPWKGNGTLVLPELPTGISNGFGLPFWAWYTLGVVSGCVLMALVCSKMSGAKITCCFCSRSR